MLSAIRRCSAELFEAPLKQPFRIATGQHTSLSNVIFKIELRNGISGFGEAAVAEHITGENVAVTLANLRKTARKLQGRPLSGLLAVSCSLHEQLPANKSAVAAVETALFDCLSRQLGVPLWKLFGGSARKLETDITIVLGSLEETEESCRRFLSRGFRKFKVKIGGDFELDLKRVAAVSRLIRKSALYLDANQAYTPRGILRFLRELGKMKITPQLLEQPVARTDWDGLKEVSRKTTVPVCADESASSLEDCLRIARENICPVVNIKLMKTGLVHAREIASVCRSRGIRLMIGSMMETSLSATAAAHLAAGMGCFTYIDLDTPFFIKPGFDRNPYVNSRGVYDLTRIKAGIGLIPAPLR